MDLKATELKVAKTASSEWSANEGSKDEQRRQSRRRSPAAATVVRIREDLKEFQRTSSPQALRETMREALREALLQGVSVGPEDGQHADG
jgi:hypothetical protein